jgi:uncharacterized membrane protein YfcA
MSLLDVLTVLGAGLGAGVVMASVGGGSLVSFPLLLGVGLSPLVANVCNNVGLVPGGVTASFGYRRELAGRRGLVVRVAATSAVGALAGAGLLLALPTATFGRVVPFLVLTSATLIGVQPLVSAGLRRRAGGAAALTRESMGPVLTTVSAVVGVYGGYFGAAQGVLLMACLGLGLDLDLQVVNGLKNVAVLAANVVAGVVFVVLAPLDWRVVGLVAVGSVVGGWAGAHLGRRLPPVVFRGLVVLVGWGVGLRLLLG